MVFMRVRRIALLTGNPLRSNPRVIKEAAALAEAGFEVRVHGAWSTEQGVETDRNLAEQGGYAFVPLLPPDTLEGRLHGLVQRAARKVIPWSKWTFGLMPGVLEREARRFRPELAIAHSEPALFAALALQMRGTKVGVDMEDWFSEDLPAEAQRGRPVRRLRETEKQLLKCVAHATCTTEAMADALSAEYGAPRPRRIYNVFPEARISDPVMLVDRSSTAKSMGGLASRGAATRSIHWFSQTLGPGRGLEELLAAAAAVAGDFEIHLRGHVGGYQGWLKSAVPAEVQAKVFVHKAVANEVLPERIAEHDIGFAGELRGIRSRDLTATNKIFQYLQSGLAVVASDTKGQREVADASAGAVRLYESGNRNELSAVLRDWAESPGKLQAARAAAREVAARKFRWEDEKHRLVECVREALQSRN